MRQLSGLLALCLVPVAAGAAGPDPKWEGRARKALADGDRAALRELAIEFRKLQPAERAELPVRVREDAVEFAFRGEFRGDQFNPDMLEYLASAPGKDYESLLVVTAAEEERVQALRPIFEKRPVEGRRKGWSARLVWSDGDSPRSVELPDVLILIGPDERDQFLDRLAINGAGLGGSTNVKCDPGVLPRKRVPARLYLTVRMVGKE